MAFSGGLMREVLAFFDGGINDTGAKTLLPDGVSPDCQNVIFGKSGVLEKMEGWAIADTIWLAGDLDAIVNGGSGTIKSMTFKISGTEYFVFIGKYFVKYSLAAAGPVKYLGYSAGTVTVTNGSATVTGAGTAWVTQNIKAGDLFIVDGDNTGVDDTVFYTVQSVGAEGTLTLTGNYAGTSGGGKAYRIAKKLTTSNFRVGAAVFNAELYISDGTNNPWRSNMATCLEIATMPKSTNLLAFKNKLFTGGSAAAYSTVNWCTTYDGTSWPADNNQKFPNEGTPGVLALREIYGGIIVCFRKMFYLFVGDTFDVDAPDYDTKPYAVPDDFEVTNNIDKVIVQRDNRLWFVGKHDFYQADTRRITSISLGRYDTALGRAGNTTGTPDGTPYMAAGVWGGDIFFGWRNATPTNKGTRIDANLAIWPMTATASGYVAFGGKFYRTLDNVLYVLSNNRTDDGTTGFTAYWIGRPLLEKALSSRKRYTYAIVTTLVSGSDNYSFEYDADGGGSAFVSPATTLTISGSNVDISERVDLQRIGKNLTIKFSNSTASKNFRPLGVEIFYTLLNPISGV